MFPKTSIVAALAGIFTFAAASLPTTLIISVIDATTGVTLGSLNGYGNFSSPGPDYPFYSEVATGEYSTIYGYGQCTVGDFLDCYGGSGAGVDFFVSLATISIRNFIMNLTFIIRNLMMEILRWKAQTEVGQLPLRLVLGVASTRSV